MEIGGVSSGEKVQNSCRETYIGDEDAIAHATSGTYMTIFYFSEFKFFYI